MEKDDNMWFLKFLLGFVNYMIWFAGDVIAASLTVAIVWTVVENKFQIIAIAIGLFVIFLIWLTAIFYRYILIFYISR